MTTPINQNSLQWHKSSHSVNNGSCVEVAATTWRKSTRSNGQNACLEVACVHDAPWFKSSRSGGSGGNCVEAASLLDSVAVRDSKLDTTGDFPVLTMTSSDWSALLHTVRSRR